MKSLPGGVAGNIAADLALLKNLVATSVERVSLISVVGNDTAGETMVEALRSVGVDVCGVGVVNGGRTPCVVAVLNNNGDVSASIADVDLVEKHLQYDLLVQWSEALSSASVVVMDGDLSPDGLKVVCQMVKRQSPKENKKKTILWFEPAAPDKAGRISGLLPWVDYISPNVDELKTLTKTLLQSRSLSMPTDCLKKSKALKVLDEFESTLPRPLLDSLTMVCFVLEAGVEYILLTLGEHGAALCHKHDVINEMSSVSILYAPALPAMVKNCSGGGDSLVAGFVHALVNGTKDNETCLQWGIVMAKLAVESSTNWASLQGIPNYQDLHNLASFVRVQKFKIPLCCYCPSCLGVEAMGL